MTINLPDASVETINTLSSRHHLSPQETIENALALAETLSNEKDDGKTICAMEGIQIVVLHIHPFI